MTCIRILALASLALLYGCDAYVERAKYDASQKETTEAKEALRKAQEQIAQCQSHKYQIFHRGFRTWRLDTVAGTSCVMLTTEEDWKKYETKGESCACEDVRNAYRERNVLAPSDMIYCLSAK